MAIELVAGTAQLRLITFNAQCSEQLRTGGAGQVFKVQPQSRGALMICKITDRQPRCNHAEPLVEGGELAQKRLERRLTYPSFLRTRRILERLQAVENQ